MPLSVLAVDLPDSGSSYTQDSECHLQRCSVLVVEVAAAAEGEDVGEDRIHFRSLALVLLVGHLAVVGVEYHAVVGHMDQNLAAVGVAYHAEVGHREDLAVAVVEYHAEVGHKD